MKILAYFCSLMGYFSAGSIFSIFYFYDFNLVTVTLGISVISALIGFWYIQKNKSKIKGEGK